MTYTTYRGYALHPEDDGELPVVRILFQGEVVDSAVGELAARAVVDGWLSAR